MNFDNIEFITFLKENGFYIPDNYTHSNYHLTERSIPAVLNMNYLEPAILELPTQNQRSKVLIGSIDDNTVMNYLKSIGYQTINVNSGWWGTNTIHIADKNLCPTFVDHRVLSKLERTTILHSFNEIHKEIHPLFNDQKRPKILCQFSELEKIKDYTERPFFVLAHIMVTHPPYVFGPEGEPKSRNASVVLLESHCVPAGVDGACNVQKTRLERRHQAYVDQLKFSNKMMMELISKLLSNTETPPIIIIQSDHGTRDVDERWTKEEQIIVKVGNFNAFFLPGNGTNLIYEEITPVNTFRVIFNSYFNTDLELLEDKVFISNNWIYDLKQSVDSKKK